MTDHHEGRPPRDRPGGEEGADLVSVVVVCFNNLEFTRRCVEALRRHTPPGAYELILVDNASTDGTADYLATLAGEVPNVRIVSNAENLGFGGGNNRGVDEARGGFLFFLNNDTEVQAGWLAALVALAARRRDAGAIGCKLIYPDGRLQEAGALVFKDGSAWNFGRFDDPDDPEYEYVREVDYASGAALLVRHDLFREIGGFDPRYDPAYYEDVDLCFAVRGRGACVLFQPLARVIHHEGVTGGLDVASGAKRHQVLNQPKFVEKWLPAVAALPLRPADAEEARLLADRATRDGGRVLVVVEQFRAASQEWRIALDWCRRERAAGCHVTCLVVSAAGCDDPALDDLRQAGVLVRGATVDGVQAALADVRSRRRYGRILTWPEARLSAISRMVAGGAEPTGGSATGAAAGAGQEGSSREPGAREGAGEGRRLNRGETGMHPGNRNVRGLTLGDGFHEVDRGTLWIGPAADLFVWREALARPSVLAVELRSAAAARYATLPIRLRIGVGPSADYEVSFEAGGQARAISLALPAVDHDLRIHLECDSTVTSSRGGATSDVARGTEPVSLQVVALALRPGAAPAHLAGTRGHGDAVTGPTELIARDGVAASSAGFRSHAGGPPIAWCCNVCARWNVTPVDHLRVDEEGRDGPCAGCGSGVGLRTVVHALSTALLGESVAIDDFPVRHDLRGLGIGDRSEAATRLAGKVTYTVTALDAEPRFDLSSIDPALDATFDFIVVHGTLDEVPPPVSSAFENLHRLLVPGGVLVVWVPYTMRDPAVEREDPAARPRRAFCRDDLLAQLAAAGFHSIDICQAAHLGHGIVWPYPWSIPLAARK
jgi:GT2 family glycosyltransferase/SAM-dependent methyltransferase